MMNFTNDEMNLMCIYQTGDRQGLISTLKEMQGYPINLGCFRRMKAKQAVCRLLSGKPRQKR